MQPPEGVTVRPAQTGDLDTMDQMMLQEGWPTDLLRRRSLIARHPTWWSVATSRQEVVLGQLGLVRPDPESRCYTEYIMEPKSRGRGVGTMMWKTLSADDSDFVTSWLCAFHGSRAWQVYKELYDFQHCYFYTMYEGTLDEARLTSALGQAQPAGPGGDGDLRLVPLQGATPQLLLYDAQVRGKERCPDFFKDYVLSDNVSASAAILNGSGDVIGYGVLHRFDERGHILGPVYADNDDVARKLLGYLLGTLSEGERIFINAITDKDLMKMVAQKLDLKEVYTLTFMKTGGGDSGIQLHKVYANSSSNCYDYV